MISSNVLNRMIYPLVAEDELDSCLLALVLANAGVEEMGSLLTFMRSLLAASMLPDLLSRFEEIGRRSIDCSGTGGSGLLRFNTSTTVAFVLAAAGLNVVKFGNRSAGGRAGSFDFLEALGFPLYVDLPALPEAVENTGLVFLYAGQVYPVLGRLTAARRRLQSPTMLNFLGPLLNPVRPAYRIMGVSNAKMLELLPEVISRYCPETRQALLVRSASGLDEIAPEELNDSTEIIDGRLKRFVIDGRDDLGDDEQNLDRDPLSGDMTAEENVRIFYRIIEHEDRSSRHCRQVLINAAYGLLTAGRCSSLRESLFLTRALLKDGVVARKFEQARRYYERLSI